ncbi:hypothetical protein HHI36_018688 [Cryptolaemus montrouzieri]|uniref:Uncharacterized protein n=1 Tax=Cryptolaemus montrouzieri TaxID=559131 RepID=A0ABD2P0P6_9CUCU
MQCECCAARWRSASLTVPSVVVVAIYRRSSGAFNVLIQIMARILDALGVYGRHRIVIVGDYNVDFLVVIRIDAVCSQTVKDNQAGSRQRTKNIKCDATFFSVSITYEDIIVVVKNNKASPSMGPDGFSTVFVKKYIRIFVRPFRFGLNYSLERSISGVTEDSKGGAGS